MIDVLALWIAFGVVLFAMGCVAVGLSRDRFSSDDPLRLRLLGYKLLLTGLLLPLAVPVWAFVGARYLIKQVRSDLGELATQNTDRQLREAQKRIAELEKEVGFR